ncbi:MAG: hypothetical protein Q8Q35_00520 [Nanoarchaeota archaeon]|nr:hypothetical protein [Nanoarchaeota archaeon]
MKRGLLYILMVIFLLGLVTASTNSVLLPTLFSNQVDVRLEIVRYSPSPVSPGQYFDLWVSVETQGDQSTTSIINLGKISGVEIELVEDYPFTLDPNDEAMRYLGTLDLGTEEIVKYRVKVADDATTGDHDIKFIFRSNDDENGVLSPALNINVQDLDPTLNVIVIETNPEQLMPGSPATLDITVRNDAGSAFSSLTSTIEIDRADVPIVPYKSSKEKSIRSLDAGEEYTFSYEVIPEENAEAGVYKIPYTISYRDNENNLYQKNDTFGLLIGAEADLAFNLEQFDTFQKNSKGMFVVSVSNVGPSELKFMNIELLEGDGYVTLSPNQEYLGNLESDDFETSSFEIYVSEQDVELNFKLSYKDVYNTEYVESFSLDLPIYSASEVDKYGLNGRSQKIYNYILYLVIILFVYYGYSGWKKLKKLDGAIAYGIKEVVKFPFRVILFFRPRNIKRWPMKIQSFFKEL